ncbi:hypothetical protein M8C21_014251 [Ambrosia artemisiifolia]|uniref:Uncharacterized protein n=1 Tax=Ambrosia artemisiifolia TaxID=4212 RepID=A0AAD5CS01_AMBAR|nr:hypothetical protein M8C21_014251 [Ambrosia artemisiifolia]
MVTAAHPQEPNQFAFGLFHGTVAAEASDMVSQMIILAQLWLLLEKEDKHIIKKAPADAGLIAFAHGSAVCGQFDGSVVELDNRAKTVILNSLNKLSSSALRALGFAYKEDQPEFTTYNGDEDHPVHNQFRLLAGYSDELQREKKKKIYHRLFFLHQHFLDINLHMAFSRKCSLFGAENGSTSTVPATLQAVGCRKHSTCCSFRVRTTSPEVTRDIIDNCPKLTDLWTFPLSCQCQQNQKSLILLAGYSDELFFKSFKKPSTFTAQDSPCMEVRQAIVDCRAVGIQGKGLTWHSPKPAATEASDMVLAGDGFCTIVAAVVEGSLFQIMRVMSANQLLGWRLGDITHLVSNKQNHRQFICCMESINIFLTVWKLPGHKISGCGIKERDEASLWIRQAVDVGCAVIGEVPSTFLTAAMGIQED